MASSSYLGRRPRPASPVPDEASSSRRRTRYFSTPSPLRTRIHGSPSYWPASPSYSPTAPSYSPTTPSYPHASGAYPPGPRRRRWDDDEVWEYSPRSPLYAPADWAYSPEPRRGSWDDDDEIGRDEAGGSGGQQQHDDDHEEESEGDDDGVQPVHSDGSDGGNGVASEERNGDEDDMEDEPGSEGQDDGDHEEQSDGEREDEFSDESDGQFGMEDEDADEDEEEEYEEEYYEAGHDEEDEIDEDAGSERDEEHGPAAAGADEEEEQQQQPSHSARGGAFSIVFDDASDGENVVDDEQQAGVQGEEDPLQPQQPQVDEEDVAAAVAGAADLAKPRPEVSSAESSGIGEITVEGTHALDCGICFLPLKPPIFLCDVGHVVCSPCRDKLAAGPDRRCHVCRAPTEFRRCHAMEQLVDSIRVACPHAAHGCADRPAYHDRERHARECAHAPCRCPGDACGFAGPMAALVEHLAAAHGWPCTAEPDADAGAGRSFSVDLRDGFNFLTAARGRTRYLILLNMASTAFGRAISAVRIRPHAAATASSSVPVGRRAECELELRCSRYHYQHYPRGHYQTSRFVVACANGSSELPDPNVSFQFLIPKYVPGSESDEAAFQVTAVIFINSHES